MTTSWHMDETYIKLIGHDYSLYRAAKAAKTFFRKAFRQYGQPEKVCIDKSDSNKSALMSLQKTRIKHQTL